jgi:hypothetical protein
MALRIISQAPYNAHTEPLFKNLKLLPLLELIELSKAQFMFLYARQLLPPLFLNAWNQVELNNYNLRRRNQDNFIVPFSRLSMIDKLPLIAFPTAWNKIEDVNIKSSKNIFTFNNSFKDNALSKLLDRVNCNRLFCAACTRI